MRESIPMMWVELIRRQLRRFLDYYGIIYRFLYFQQSININNIHLAKQFMKDQSLRTGCRPYVHLSVNERSFRQFKANMWSVLTCVARDYRYKSLATQISHDAGLTPIPYTYQKLICHRGSSQRCTPQYEFKISCYQPRYHGAATDTQTYIYLILLSRFNNIFVICIQCS